MSEHTAHSLIALASAGDKEAFGLVVTRHMRTLQAVAARLVHDPEQARECVQEALLRALLSISTLREHDRFKSWLCGIVRNVCLDHVRRRRVIPLPGDSVARLNDPDPQQNVETQELQRHMWRAIGGLSAKNRRAVQLFYFECHSHRETAAQLGISTAAVKGRLHKSRQHLRTELAPLYPELAAGPLPRRHPVQTITELRCSFCGKAAAQVPKLVTGPGVNICSQCIALCVDVMEKDGVPLKRPQKRRLDEGQE